MILCSLDIYCVEASYFRTHFTNLLRYLDNFIYTNIGKLSDSELVRLNLHCLYIHVRHKQRTRALILLMWGFV